MYARKTKGVNKKAVVAAIVLVAVLAVGAAAVVLYSFQGHAAKTTAKVGVKVGDYFSYELTGEANGPVPSTISPDFSIYNNTDYYKVTVTAIEGTKVTLDTVWAFKNGTTVNNPQTIDLASGILTDQNGFYALYPADMVKNQLVYPHVYSGVWVNGTDPLDYSSGSRQINYYTATGTLYYSQDPTHSTQCSTWDQVSWDKTTGMLTNLISARNYNNPQLSTEILWTLTSTNLWTV